MRVVYRQGKGCRCGILARFCFIRSYVLLVGIAGKGRGGAGEESKKRKDVSGSADDAGILDTRLVAYLEYWVMGRPCFIRYLIGMD